MTRTLVWISALRGPAAQLCDDDAMLTVEKYERVLARHDVPDECADCSLDALQLKAELIPSRELIDTLRAERAELIEALRPMAVDMGDTNWDDMGLAELELTIGDCRRARALLERLGAVPGHGWHDLSKHPERDL